MKTVRQQWHAPMTEWVNFLKSDGSAVTTVRGRRYQLYFVSEAVRKGPWRVTESDLRKFFLAHPEWSTNTRHTYASALRSFYGWAVARGLRKTDPTTKLPKVKATVGRPRPIPEAPLADALARSDGRVLLMLQLGSQLGLRRFEIAKVHTRDLMRQGEGWGLRVMGKGGTECVLPVVPELAATLRALPTGWAFPNGRRNGGHLGADRVGRILSQELDHYTSHQLRHRFGTMVYRGSRDILFTRDMLRHQSVETTEVYAAPDTSDAAKRLQGWVA